MKTSTIHFVRGFALLMVLVWVGSCNRARDVESPAPPTQALQPTRLPTEVLALPSPTAQPTLAPTVQITEEPTDAPTALPTATLAPTATPDQRAVPEIAADLAGLPIEAFFDESFKLLLLRSPEKITFLGLAREYGLRNDRLDDLSEEYVLETQELETVILDLLRSFDRESLPPQQQISYDVYEWYLENQVRGHAFTYHDYPFHPFYGGYHSSLNFLLTSFHPLNTRQDVEDYIARLSQVDRQVDQLLAGVRKRQEMGVVMPRFIIERSKGDLFTYLGTFKMDLAEVEIRNLDVYATFSQAMGKIESLTEEEKDAYREAAIQEIETSFLPAYFKLVAYLNEVAPLATQDAGVWKLPGGDEYYAYMLRTYTSTELTPEEAHAIGLGEVARIQEELQVAFADLGYAQDKNLPGLLNGISEVAGYYDISSPGGKASVIRDTEALLAQAKQRAQGAFDIWPAMELVVVGADSPPASYEPGSLDGSRPGAYHVPLMGSSFPRYTMATMTYHEGFPGHYMQVEIAREMGLPLFQSELALNGYVEGWALYAERLAWELGLYENDPYGNIGRLHFELLRAVRVVVDTGIHALGWTRDEALAYMTEVTGSPSSYEVDRYVVWPAQATGYTIGMVKILELRQRAMDVLGDDFDLAEFHTVLLSNGELPLAVLERVVDDYIESKGEQG